MGIPKSKTNNRQLTTRSQSVFTANAPAPIGPYSQAINAGGFLWTSGQIALDPATGEMVPGGIAEQTVQACRNLAAVLEAAGLGMEAVVKTTIYLTDMALFPAVNEIYGRFFGGEAAPARSTVSVAALPRGALVEIEAVAQT
ncbi:MAG: RidA family protein [bacterium]|jgi:2-iminobutanoate/2-iminopropanoate deaminase|nr:RidA family protein [bacterium]MDD3804935.1 RidA family protein [bacterium]MDD4153460.1 RidA family protein [bacterium]MDD4558392.1 RidA family protein [bacterium]